ncbi:hypothetical protein Tco_1136230 [Tanacetum coccineum]
MTRNGLSESKEIVILSPLHSSHPTRAAYTFSFTFSSEIVELGLDSSKPIRTTESIITKFLEKLPLQFKGGVLVDRGPSNAPTPMSKLREQFPCRTSCHALPETKDNKSMTNTPYSIGLNTPYRRFDTSYPTGGYSISGDQSE